MSVPANPELTYGEFTKRRAHLLGRINRLKEEYKRATDPRYTALVDNPGKYALDELNRTEAELGALIAAWTLQQSTKGE